MNDFVSVLYQSILSFAILFVISKILGKKQVAQLEFSDYVVGISIGSIAAQMATEPDIPFYHFLVAMAIYGLFDLLITIISRKSHLLKSIFKGHPLVLIRKGQIDYTMLKKSKLDLNELQSLCRTKGYFDLGQIHYCLFEPNGDFSILPKAATKPTVKQDLNIKEEEQELLLDIVVDGKIKKDSLQQIGKDSLWLLKKAGVDNRKQLKEKVILMTFSPSDKTVQVFCKQKK